MPLLVQVLLDAPQRVLEQVLVDDPLLPDGGQGLLLGLGQRVAGEVAKAMRGNPELSNVNFDWSELSKAVAIEIDQDKADRARGMDITVVTTARTNDEGRALLKALGFPFKTND